MLSFGDRLENIGWRRLMAPLDLFCLFFDLGLAVYAAQPLHHDAPPKMTAMIMIINIRKAKPRMIRPATMFPLFKVFGNR